MTMKQKQRILNYRRNLRLRRKLMEKDKFVSGETPCPYCRKPMKDKSGKLSVDHVHPISKGFPDNDLDNCVLSCVPCNKKKGDMMPLEFIWQKCA